MSDTTTAPRAIAGEESAGKEGRYLTFALGEEEYGVDIGVVREIIGALPVTHVPQVPPHVRGVINLRGGIIPVVELRLRFGLPEVPYTSETCYIVIETGRTPVGVAVDRVIEVLDLPDREVAPPPAFGERLDTAYIQGIGKVGQRVVILLDIRSVLSSTEAAAGEAPLAHAA